MNGFVGVRRRFHKICRYPVSDFAIIAMLTVSFFCLFLGGKIQQAKNLEQKDKERFSYRSEYYADFVTSDSNMNISDVFVSDTGNISITNVDAFSDYEESLRLAQIILHENEEICIPLSEGCLFSQDKNTDYVVVIGQGLKEYAVKKDGNEYMRFDGEDYRVIGVCGGTDSDIFDYAVLFSFERTGSALQKRVQDSLETGLHFVIQSNVQECEEIYSTLEDNVMDLDGAQINGYSDEETEGAYVTRTDDTGFYWLAALFCIINTICVSEFWVFQRREEIQIRRKIGQSKAQILWSLYFQNIKISGIAAVIAFLIKATVQMSGWFSDVSLTTDFYDVIIFLFCIVAGSAIVIVYPLYQMGIGSAIKRERNLLKMYR